MSATQQNRVEDVTDPRAARKPLGRDEWRVLDYTQGRYYRLGSHAPGKRQRAVYVEGRVSLVEMIAWAQGEGLPPGEVMLSGYGLRIAHVRTETPEEAAQYEESMAEQARRNHEYVLKRFREVYGDVKPSEVQR